LTERGCIGWYTKLLVEIISKLGPEYVAHGISYAGHGVGRSKVVGESAPNKARVTRSFPWTIQGQVDHKIEYICKLLERYRRSRNCQIEIIFVAHSIGSHMVQRICLLRPDLLSITKSVVHLMPFIRFAPSLRSQRLPISVIAHMPKKFSVHILKKLSNLGRKFSFQQTFNLLSDEVKCPEGRVLAASLVRDPEMACNFLSLGVEEIRDLPEARFDVEAMKVINQKSPIYILLCGGPDQWAPHEIFQEFHNNQRKAVPGSSAHLFVNIKYLEELIHGFIVEPTMIPPVVEFIVKSINGAETPSMQAKYFGRSRL